MSLFGLLAKEDIIFYRLEQNERKHSHFRRGWERSEPELLTCSLTELAVNTSSVKHCGAEALHLRPPRHVKFNSNNKWDQIYIYKKYLEVLIYLFQKNSLQLY